MKKQTVKKKLVKKKPVKKDNRNALIKSLRGKIKEQEEVLEKIQSFNKSLEKQVEERTEELLTINKQLDKEISKKTLAEKTLKEKNERLKYHIENSPLAVVEWDADYVVTQWSKEAERVFGYSACETLGKKIESLNLIYESDIPIVVKTMELLSCGKESTIVSSNRNITKSGNIIECVWYNSVLLDSEKNMNSVQSLVLDITEKKKDEDALLKSEEQYHSLFNMMLEGFCIIEVVFDKEQRPIDYRFLEINPVFEGQTGLHDAQGKLMRELAPDHEEHWFEIYGKVALTGEPIRFVNEAKALNRFYDVSAYRIGGKDSRKVAILFNDISENKKMEEMLRTTLQRFYLILSNLHAGILLVTDDDRVEFANQALCDSFNLIESPNDLLNLSANELINKIIISYNDPDEAVSRIKEIVSQRKSVSGEEVCMSNGRNFLRDFISINLGEKRYGRLWVNIDITDRKRAEAELIKLASFPLHNPNPVTELDFDGCIHYCNPAVYKLFPDLIRDGLNHPWLTHWQSIVEELNLDNSLRIIREVLVGDKYYLQTIHFVEETHHFRIYGTDITKRKDAEFGLKESEQKFYTTLASIGDAVIATDLNGIVIFINPVAEQLTGWILSDAVNKPVKEIFNIVNEQTGSEVENPVTKVLKSGLIEGLANHTILIRKDGTKISIDDSGAPIKDGEGNTSGVVLVFRDITERKKAENTLRESEERFRNIFELPKAAMLLIEPGTGTIVDANEAAANYYGWSRVQLQKMKIQDINILPSDEVHRKREEAVEAKSNYFVFQHRLAGGEIRWVEVYSSQILVQHKSLLFSIIHDITERKEIENNLSWSESNIRGILNATKESIFMFDCKGKIITANITAAKRLGYKVDEIIGHLFSEYSNQEVSSYRQKQLDIVFASGKSLQFEDVRNGMVFSHNFYPVFEYDKVIRVVSFSQDITEQKKSEEMIQHLATFPRLNPNPIIEIDFLGEVIFTNDAVKNILDELEIKDNGSVFLPDDIFGIIASIINANETQTFIREVNIKDHLFSINIYYTKQLKVLRLYAIDITQQKIMENQLRKLSRAVEQSPESIVITNTNGIIEYVNPKFEEITGYSLNEARGKNPRILKSGQTPPEVYENLWTNINNGKEWRGELYNKKKNGEFFWESISISPVKNSEGIVTNIVAIKEDITEKKNQVELLFRLNRTLKAMRDSNEAILRCDDESQFMNEVCKVIVEDCGHKLVWIGFAEDNISKKINPVAFYGKDKEYVEKLNITWDDSDYGNGPTGIAIKTGKAAICRNMFTSTDFEPWREEALKRGFASSIVFPFKINSEIAGAITIYSSDQDPFSSEEINLLSELVNDLSYGIGILRLKKAKEKADIELRKHRDNLEELVKLRSGELKAANEELKSASLYMRTLLEASLDPLVTIDKTGVITDVNMATELVTGLSRKELIGNNFSDYFTDPGKAKLGFNKVISKGFVRDFPLTISNISGKRTEVLYNATIYKNEAGEILGVFAAARDITEQRAAEIELNIYRKHLEELVKTRTIELASANKQLSEEIEKEKKVEILLKESLAKEKELNELKTRFLSTTSHEFRTPLTSILSSMQLVQKYRKKWSDEQVDEHFIKVKYSVQNLTKLLDDVLTLNRSESGKLTFSPGTLDLHKFTLDILKEVEHIRTEKHEIIFNYSLKRSEYILDAKLMNFIIMNLMTNAIKYSPNGGKVELNISHYGNQIQIIVSDEGIGIPKEEYDRLFEPFNRAKNTDNIPGTGLGLSIVKLAVQMYNGKIDFQSELGKGTKFIVIIPSENK
jgi:PAS domain S-box-containing protein